MVLSVYLLASCCFLLCFLLLWKRRHFYKVAYLLPGPIGLPFIGMGIQMMNPESFLQYLEKTSKKYKSPFVSWMGTKCFLYVNDPETVETVFNSPHCTNKGDFYRFIATAIGDGLFTSSSPRWNKHRRLINPAFSRQTISNFLEIFNKEADVLLDVINEDGIMRQGQIEIYQLVKKSVLEAACQTTMGKKMNFQNDGSQIIFDSYNSITEVCVKRILSPWLYTDFIYKRSSLYKLEQKVVKVLYGFVEKLLQVSNQSNTSMTLKPTTSKPADYNSHTSNVTVDNNEYDDSTKQKTKSIFVEQVRKHIEQGNFTWNDVRDEANVTIAATFETTSTALYLVCLLLALHPECQDRLHDELSKIFPNPDYGSNKKSYLNITHEALQRLTYTEMVINEAMRLFAPVPIVLRRAAVDFPLRNGIIIPRGTQIGIDIFNMQRSESVWGVHASDFRPEEHFGTSANPRHAFAFIPFTKGLRMCIGYRYALMLMKVFIAKIFLYYRISTDAKMSDLIVKGTISLKLREYPLCRVERRERHNIKF